MKDRVFVVCGGNSLKNYELGWLHSEDTIAVNYAAEHFDEPTYFITADSGCIAKSVKSNFWKLTDKTKKVVVINKIHPRYDKVKDLLGAFDEYIEQTTSEGDMVLPGFDGFATGKNTGFAALQYAIKLGYKKIYLLGVDLQFTEGDKYFYGKGGNPSPYELFYQHYVTGLTILNGTDISVFSCSPISKLNQHIPFVDLNSLVPVMPVFVSHYTKSTPYEQEVQNLIKSLERHGLDYDIEGIEPLKDWRANSNYCAWQVQAMLKKHKPRSIVRVDADARIQRYPKLFEDFGPDIGACIWKESRLKYYEKDGEFMGGTLFFLNNERTEQLVYDWVDACTIRPRERNGDLLFELVKVKKKAKLLKFRTMPLEYCKIFDFQMGGVTKPVIEHFQASRRFKRIVNQIGAKKCIPSQN
jgi:hypothetical protein